MPESNTRFTMLASFRGWKRKIGVVTLAMACGLTCLWMLTNQFSIHVATAYIDPVQFLTAKDGYLRWASYPGVTISQPVSIRIMPPHEIDGGDIIESKGFQQGLVWVWHWKWGGFEFGNSVTRRVRIWAAPFWSIVLPLTLLSAWLLHSKPRPAKKPEPAPTTGT